MAHELPEGAYLKDISAHYNQHTIPRHLLVPSLLETDMWARVVVEKGHLNLRLGKKGETERVLPGQPAVIPTDTYFSFGAAPEEVLFYIEYHHGPKLADPAELASQLGRRGGSGSRA